MLIEIERVEVFFSSNFSRNGGQNESGVKSFIALPTSMLVLMNLCGNWKFLFFAIALKNFVLELTRVEISKIHKKGVRERFLPQRLMGPMGSPKCLWDGETLDLRFTFFL